MQNIQCRVRIPVVSGYSPLYPLTKIYSSSLYETFQNCLSQKYPVFMKISKFRDSLKAKSTSQVLSSDEEFRRTEKICRKLWISYVIQECSKPLQPSLICFITLIKEVLGLELSFFFRIVNSKFVSRCARMKMSHRIQTSPSSNELLFILGFVI